MTIFIVASFLILKKGLKMNITNINNNEFSFIHGSELSSPDYSYGVGSFDEESVSFGLDVPEVTYMELIEIHEVIDYEGLFYNLPIESSFFLSRDLFQDPIYSLDISFEELLQIIDFYEGSSEPVEKIQTVYEYVRGLFKNSFGCF